MLKSATSTVALRTRVCTVCPHADGAELNWNGVDDPDAFICKQFCIRGDTNSAHTGTDRHESRVNRPTLYAGHPRFGPYWSPAHLSPAQGNGSVQS